MNNYLPGFARLLDRCECPKCGKGFGVLQGSQSDIVQCPTCGERGSKHLFLTTDSLLFELALSRQKMAKAVWQATKDDQPNM
ncbi:hypothetical protein CLV36_10787 [Laceyella sediminis]|uniref:Uncharacterized protein n=1 Tax=Laceyella sediminis TaxID=573074 RepID=A0ABX5EP38_9BACL|nr:hypothetical protein [Laceyella sediminis]PRZ13892.1 hypothetical protein CLV36_10787 [Laceyella sediminis]